MNCSACRKEIADGSNFCPYCGTTQVAPPAGAGVSPLPGTGTAIGGVRESGGVVPPAGTYSQGGVTGGTTSAGASQRAVLSLVLGIAAIVADAMSCCCYGLAGPLGIGLGIAAFILARNEMEDIDAGLSSPAGRSNAEIGKILGIAGIGIGVLLFLGGISVLALAILSDAGNF